MKENAALAPGPYSGRMSQLAREKPARERARLFGSDDGAAAVEYALLSAMIAGAIVTAVVAFGSSLSETLSYVASAVEDVAQSGSSVGGGPGANGNGKGGNGQGNNGNGKGNGGSNRAAQVG
jgi:Flp pilus assembly pilin Flp